MANTTKSTITLHVVSSLDGFIARNDNTISWMDSPGEVYDKGVTDSGSAEEEVLESIDCYILGSRTYEHALQLGWPYGETPTIVVTSRALPSTRAAVEFYAGDLRKLIEERLAPRYRNIWLVGGAILGQSFLRLGLVDEIRLVIAPVTLGNGLSLFGNSLPEHTWMLKNVVAYKNGFLDVAYRRRTSPA